MKPRLSVIVLAGVLLAWFFAPQLAGTSSFAFRDAAHFYHPLFEYVRGQWLAGRLPLWNPYENLGVPLAAQNTSSVFYPAQLLLLLPLDFTWLYNVYIVLHVALAAASAYALARHFKSSALGAGIGALAYAFGGSVLFGYSNVVFLVSAAWLPLAMLLADRMVRDRRAGSAVGLGVVLALMILGGDPQMAYNAVLLIGLLALMVWRDELAVPSPLAGQGGSRAVLVALALIVAVSLAAVQILPALEAAPHTQRAKYDAPRNVYELATWSSTQHHEPELAWYEGLLGRNASGHGRQIYQFSVAPWRAAELVWPNVLGGAFPTNRRWLGGLGREASPWDLWTPTLYMGLVPLVLAAATWSVRRRAPLEIRFLSWMTALGAIASLGVYGVAWAVGAERLGIGGEVGGLYWLMAVLLPKYVYFRYPAKMFVVASLGLAMLAARGWDAAWQIGGRRVRWILWAIAVASFAGLLATAVLWSSIQSAGADHPPTPILGPLDWSGARRDVTIAFAQAAALSAACLAALALGAMRPRWKPRIALGLLAVVALDLAVAQRALVVGAAADAWAEEPKVLAALPVERDAYRVFRQPGIYDPSWEESFSPDRFAECVRWDRQTLLPKYPLRDGLSSAEASQTLVLDDYRVVLEVARSFNRRVAKSPLPHASILDLLGVQAAIVAADARDEQSAISAPQVIAAGAFLVRRPRALARAWIVHEIEVVPRFTSRSPAELRELTETVLFAGGKPRDWRRSAVVESDEPVALRIEPLDGAIDESCRVVRCEPLVVAIEAKLAAPGLVVLSDFDYPGWRLTVESDGQSRDAPILRTNRVMRGALLPAGTHRLVYRYRPRSVMYGAAISATALVALLAACVLSYRARTRRRSPGKAGG